jgi:hypothetical protein
MKDSLLEEFWKHDRRADNVPLGFGTRIWARALNWDWDWDWEVRSRELK